MVRPIYVVEMGISHRISQVFPRIFCHDDELTTTGKPGLGYQKLSKHRHLDVFEREWVGDYDDRK